MRHLLFVSLSCALLACGEDEPTPPPAGNLDVELDVDPVASGFNAATSFAALGADRFLVGEQTGLVHVVENGVVNPAPFLDLTQQVSAGFELGLLGLALHPQFASNGYVYVAFSDVNWDTRVERFQVVAGNANAVDPNSQTTIYTIPQPFDHHNGGNIVFGPDGMLYIGSGDAGHEPEDSVAQDPTNVWGAILRIDVDAQTPFGIPSDNPFVGTANGADEVWAYGLRNPWRFSFDRVENNLYIGDVGERDWEEINVAGIDEGGLHYGWSVTEGTECRPGGPVTCDMNGITLPTVTYEIPVDGCSVVGGFVYRGSAIPEITGHYFYTDWCTAWLRSFRFDGTVSDLREWNVQWLGQPTSMGEDLDGELYILTANDLYRIVRTN